MPIVSIRHTTTYRYRAPVTFGEHRMMLRPLESFDQRLLSAAISISPEPSLRRDIHDAAGACIGVVRFDATADRLVFDSCMRVEHRPHAPADLDAARFTSVGTEAIYEPGELDTLAPFRRRLHPDAGETQAWAERFTQAHGATRVADLLSGMMYAIRSEFAYALRLRGKPQTPAETLHLRQGSCRDFALLMMEAARSLGLAAQFVSGYIYSSSAKAGRTGGGHTHAWTRIYLPECGWVDFDPTNGIVGNLDLIRVAIVADPRLALPLWGVWDGRADDFQGMDVAVQLDVESLQQPLANLRTA
jgi:transglutaminase-like putative cysteine protease